MAGKIEEREVIRKIKVPEECTWFVQAILEDTGLIAVSLGEKGNLTIFYDRHIEREMHHILNLIFKFCFYS